MQKLAIIGTGISGLGVAHFLREHFDLTLFEQNEYVGGHANTVIVTDGGCQVPIDTGFMVFNRATYPNLTRLFGELGVATKPTEMSFSVQHGPSGLEYNGSSVNRLFGQRSTMLRPDHWRMLLAINRFNAEAAAAIDDPRWASYTLGEYVAERGYGADMLERYLVPMSGSVWSTPPDKMRDFPVMTLLRFWRNHGFLGLTTQHQWYTVVHGAQSYVAKLTAPFADRIKRNTRVSSVVRTGGAANLTTANGETYRFDKVILACHGDQALALLTDPSPLEARLLRAFRYQPNSATLHTDESFMPRTRRCWASWNYRVDPAADGGARATIHYWMNSLQGVSDQTNYFVSLNCGDRVAPNRVLKRIAYEHPLFDNAAVAAQVELPRLNAVGRDQVTYFAGAWFKYGFHEDGLTSALDCARAVTGERLWA